jgi:hypothetical protein
VSSELSLDRPDVLLGEVDLDSTTGRAWITERINVSGVWHLFKLQWLLCHLADVPVVALLTCLLAAKKACVLLIDSICSDTEQEEVQQPGRRPLPFHRRTKADWSRLMLQAVGPHANLRDGVQALRTVEIPGVDGSEPQMLQVLYKGINNPSKLIMATGHLQDWADHLRRLGADAE